MRILEYGVNNMVRGIVGSIYEGGVVAGGGGVQERVLWRVRRESDSAMFRSHLKA